MRRLLDPASAVNAFWSRTSVPGREVFSDPETILHRSQWTVRLFYFLALVTLVHGFRALPDQLLAHPDPLWPLVWTNVVPWNVSLGVIFLLAFGGTVAAAIFPGPRLTRVAAGLGIFLFFGLHATYHGVQHRWYLIILNGVFFALMPDPSRSDDRGRRTYIELVWGALLFTLFTYSVAGLMKVEGILEALLRGDAWVFTLGHGPSAMRHQILGINGAPLAGWVLDHPGLAWLGMIAVIYVELLAMFAAFRPRLHRPWLLALIGFHVATLLTMDIFFEQAVWVLSLWTVCSPFHSRWLPDLETVRDLPLIGRPIAAALRPLLRRRPEGILPES